MSTGEPACTLATSIIMPMIATMSVDHMLQLYLFISCFSSMLTGALRSRLCPSPSMMKWCLSSR